MCGVVEVLAIVDGQQDVRGGFDVHGKASTSRPWADREVVEHLLGSSGDCIPLSLKRSIVHRQLGRYPTVQPQSRASAMGRALLVLGRSTPMRTLPLGLHGYEDCAQRGFYLRQRRIGDFVGRRGEGACMVTGLVDIESDEDDGACCGRLHDGVLVVAAVHPPLGQPSQAPRLRIDL